MEKKKRKKKKSSTGGDSKDKPTKQRPKNKVAAVTESTSARPAGRGHISLRESSEKLSEIESRIQSLPPALRSAVVAHDSARAPSFLPIAAADSEDVVAMDRRRRNDRSVRAREAFVRVKHADAAVGAAVARAVLQGDIAAEEGGEEVAGDAGFVVPEHPMERTHRLTQRQLRRALPEATARQIYDLNLPETGPYGVRYTRNGRHMLLFSRRPGSEGSGAAGHLAHVDAHRRCMNGEIFVGETVRDAVFLHNEMLYAVAQKKCTYIYDQQGTEVHQMDKHQEVFGMTFLPYHWLLATIGRAGILKYHDTSTGTLVSECRTKLGQCSVVSQNPSNALVHLGHKNGTVAMWSPCTPEPLVKMLCHRGPCTGVAVDRSGHYMATLGADRTCSVWDIRTYKKLCTHFTGRASASSLDISQRGVLAYAVGDKVIFHRDVSSSQGGFQAPYMTHRVSKSKQGVHTFSNVDTVRFRPHEDICGIGHGAGFSSVVIPGCGDPHLDSAEGMDPFRSKKARREEEVRSLLDKLSPETIALNPDAVGNVERDHDAARQEKREEEEEEKARAAGIPRREKNRKRGKNKTAKKLGRKRKNVVDMQLLKLKEKMEKEKQEEDAQSGGGNGKEGVIGSSRDVAKAKADAPAALQRFFK